MAEQKFMTQLDLLKQENNQYHSLLEQQNQVYAIMKTEHQSMAERMKEQEEASKASYQTLREQNQHLLDRSKIVQDENEKLRIEYQEMIMQVEEVRHQIKLKD